MKNIVELTSQFDLALPRIQKEAPQGGLFLYRGSQIRTDDILLPKQTLYQAELHPDLLVFERKKADPDYSEPAFPEL